MITETFIVTNTLHVAVVAALRRRYPLTRVVPSGGATCRIEVPTPVGEVRVVVQPSVGGVGDARVTPAGDGPSGHDRAVVAAWHHDNGAMFAVRVVAEVADWVRETCEAHLRGAVCPPR